MGDLLIKDIKKGEHFWEYNAEFIALEDGHSIGVAQIFGKACEQWEVKGQHVKTGEVGNFLQSEHNLHYGPQLYREQNYI